MSSNLFGSRRAHGSVAWPSPPASLELPALSPAHQTGKSFTPRGLAKGTVKGPSSLSLVAGVEVHDRRV